MAIEHFEGGYWIVWHAGHDGPTEVEHVATFEQARARWKALAASQALTPEVFGSDGAVLLHGDMTEFQMSAPRRPGQYGWSERNGYEPLPAGARPPLQSKGPRIALHYATGGGGTAEGAPESV
jgi:hypothetical protein